jgi:hypothetical protein
MMWNRKKEAPKYYEVWREFLSQARAMKLGLFTSAGVSLLLVFLSLGLARRPVYVVRVDPNGRSYLVTDVADGDLPTHQEAKAVGEAFLANYMGFDSSRPEEPLREALAMMTTRLFEQHREIYKGQNLSAHIRSLGIKTEFLVEENRIVESTVDGFVLKITGRVRSHRIEETKRESVELERKFRADLRLLRIKRTPKLPSGLLVDAFEYHLLTDQEEKGISKS